MAKSGRGLRTQMLDGQGRNKQLQDLRIYSSTFLGDHGQPTFRCNAASSTSSTSPRRSLLRKKMYISNKLSNKKSTKCTHPTMNLDAAFAIFEPRWERSRRRALLHKKFELCSLFRGHTYAKFIKLIYCSILLQRWQII
jgi:hypothetical protein